VIAWYVEAHDDGTAGELEFTREDSSPVRFLQQTTAHECDPELPVWCE